LLGGGEDLQLGTYSWTDLTYLLHKDNVSWAYYVQSGIQPDCDDNPDQTAAGCAPVAQLVDDRDAAATMRSPKSPRRDAAAVTHAAGRM
jgi:hypothetical protein